MKRSLVLFLCVVYLISCTCSEHIEIQKFRTSDSTIAQGNKTYLEWNVKNADSVVLKQQGFDEPILESAPMKSRMLVTPSFTSTYMLYAYKGEDSKDTSITLNVLQKGPDTVYIRPHVIPEPSNEKSDYVRGLKTIDSLNKNAKVNFEVFYVDRQNYPKEISLYVLAKDENGNFIANLAPPFGTKETAKAFFQSISEEIDGKEYEIANYNVEERHDTLAQKYSFSLVLDHSGSMDSTIFQLENSVRYFINKMQKKDEAAIVKFDHRIETSVALTDNKSELLNPTIYNGLNNFGGYTALIAAGDEGIRNISGIKNTKIEVLFTDGNENASLVASLHYDKGYSFKTNQLIYKARDENVKLFTIGYGNADKGLLEKISELTDGKSYYANSGSEIEQIFNELPRIFHNYYLITFKPKKLDGKHSINITCANPDGSSNNISHKTYIGKVDCTGLDTMQRQSIAHFEYKSDNLEEVYIPIIEKIANFLNQNPKSILEIHGHTDLTGTKDFNIELSKRRAEAVSKEFIKLGIAKTRIKVIPHGMSEPIWNPEITDYQKNENRRVEFVIKD